MAKRFVNPVLTNKKCKEMVIEKYARMLDDKIICQSCSEKVHML
jgi:hypothetical protein